MAAGGKLLGLLSLRRRDENERNNQAAEDRRNAPAQSLMALCPTHRVEGKAIAAATMMATCSTARSASWCEKPLRPGVADLGQIDRHPAQLGASEKPCSRRPISTSNGAHRPMVW